MSLQDKILSVTILPVSAFILHTAGTDANLTLIHSERNTMQQLLKESNLSKGRISTGVTYFDVEKRKNNSLKSPSPCSIKNIVNQHSGSGRPTELLFGSFRDDFSTQAENLRRDSMSESARLSELSFADASEIWLESKRMYNKESTILCYADYISRLKAQFGGITVKEIHIGHFVEYQRSHKAKYHPSSINHDLNTLSQLLRAAGLWEPIEQHYKPLPLPRWQPPKVLSEREEEAFFALASSNPKWWLAYWVATLTNNTTASGIELRTMKRGSVDLESSPPRIYIENGKNDYRPRPIPLNEDGVTVMKNLLRRAESIGSTQSHHFLFPFRIKRGLFDPHRPASESWIKYQWHCLVEKAVETRAISFKIKPHNLRHQSITKLLEAGAAEETVRAIAGHVTQQMLRHYSHSRIESMNRVLEKISPRKPMGIASENNKKREA